MIQHCQQYYDEKFLKYADSDVGTMTTATLPQVMLFDEQQLQLTCSNEANKLALVSSDDCAYNHKLPYIRLGRVGGAARGCA